MPDANVDVKFGSSGADSVLSDTERINAKIEQLDNTAGLLSQSMGALEDASVRLVGLGAGLFGPAILSAQKYNEAIGQGEKLSRQWQGVSQRLEQEQVELGRKSTEALLPYYELLANVVETLNQIDPELIEAGIQVGGVIALAGVVGLLVSQVGRFVTATLELRASLERAAAGGSRVARLGQLGLYGATTAGAVAASVPIGIQVSRTLGDITGNEQLKGANEEQLEETFKQVLFIAAYGILEIVQELEQTWIDINQVFRDISDFFSDIINEIGRQLELFGVTLAEVINDIAGFVGAEAGLSATAAEEARSEINRQRDANIRSGSTIFFLEGSEAANFQRRLAEFDEFLAAAGDNTQAWLESQSQAYADLLGISNESVMELIANEELEKAMIRERERRLLEAQDDWLTVNQERERATARAHERERNLLESMFKTDEAADNLAESLDTKLLDSFEDLQEGLLELEDAYNQDRRDALQEFIDEQKTLEDEYQEQRLEAEAKFADQLLELETQYQKKRQERIDTYNDRVAELERDFTQSQLEARQEYYKDEKQFIEDFNRDRIRAEQDFLRQRDQAIANLDARALFEQTEQFNIEAQRAQEDFELELSRRRREFAETQEQAAAQHQERLEQEAAQHQDRLEQAESQHRESVAKARQQFNETQAQAARAHREDLARRAKEFADQQNQARQWYLAERQARENEFRDKYQQERKWESMSEEARRQHYEQLQSDLEQFLLAQAVNQITDSVGGIFDQLPGFASGGMVPSDMTARLHGGEFVLSPDTTRVLAGRLGGNLTQNSIRNMSRSVNVGNLTVPITIEGGGAAAAGIEAAVRRALTNTLNDLAKENA